MFKNALRRLLALASLAAATAFFWGAAEAVTNHFWPPAATWWPDDFLASAFARVVFYAVVAAAATAVAAGVAALGRRLRHRPKSTRPWGAAFAAAAVVAFNAGWVVQGLHKSTSYSVFGREVNIHAAGGFFSFGAIFVLLGAALAVALGVAAGRSRALRAAGRVLRAAGAAAFVVLVVAYPAARAARPVPRGPNVVVIVLDAWRADAFRPSLMPHLAAFARDRATVYPRAWSAAPWTLPAVATLVTGQYPDVHGARHGVLAAKFSRTMAQSFRAAGYDTAAVVGNRLLDRHDPTGAGFDDFYFWDWRGPLRAIRFYETNWYGPAVRELLHRDLGPETTVAISRRLERYISRRHRRPYLLWAHYMDPHVPYAPPPGYYLPRDERFIAAYHPRQKDERFAYHRLYEDECTFVDDQLAPALARLAASPNTVVVVTADHGEEFWEHKTFEHGKSVYETATRVPLILAAPGRAPRVDETPVSQVDLAATLLALAGLPPPATMQGRSFLAADGSTISRPVFVGSKFLQLKDYIPRRQDAIIMWPRKLILDDERPSAPGEYYDLAADPGETTPLAEDLYAREMRREFYAWKAVVDARRAGSVATAGDATAADLRALGYIK